ncbi:hypothetical protein ACEZ3G_05540 [Maribacter algicola]|uniref:Uncharacterized protein n=1 Tax=Meishania litoralis TaxID=3434685 RepID=A0ACC7LGZ6_9FLAO
MDVSYLTLSVSILEWIAAICATYHFNKYKNSTERHFVYLLWFTVLVETVGRSWRYAFESSNFWVYNIYMLVLFLFYLYWYQSILEQKTLRKIVWLFAIFFTGFAVWNFVFESWDGYHKYTFVIGALLTMICTLFHFRQLLYGDEVLILKHKLSFWISTGLLLFNMGMIPLMLLSHNLNFGGKYFGIIILVLNSILYGCYIIGFQWAKEKYNRF